MTISTSDPMYFDPIRTKVKSKIRIYLIEYLFLPKHESNSPDLAEVREFYDFCPKSLVC